MTEPKPIERHWINENLSVKDRLLSLAVQAERAAGRADDEVSDGFERLRALEAHAAALHAVADKIRRAAEEEDPL